MRGASRVVNKTSGGIIANAVVKYTGDHINFLRPRFVNVNAFPAPAGRDIDNLRSRSIRATPERSDLDRAPEFFFYGRVFKPRPLDFSHNCCRPSVKQFTVQLLACGFQKSEQPKG